ncbi:MAG: glutamate-5-semialdehyde dehydrogenase [Granulosicoccaceae bacterium]
MNNQSQTTVIDPVAHINDLGQRARASAKVLSIADTDSKNTALLAMADAIAAQAQALIAANQIDLQAAGEREISEALLDRLELTPARITSMSAGLRAIAAQSDPVGAMSATELRPSGLEIGRMRVPLGVIGVIYESRPNVTADAAAICLKSGNSVILRGGSEAFNSNQAIAACVRAGLEAGGLPLDCVQLVATTDRDAVGALLAARDWVDVIVPRGGKNLVARVSEDARVPVIKHLDGICHVYIDSGADRNKALGVAFNSKTYRYGICGSMETLLVADSETDILLELAKQLEAHGVELRGCEQTRNLLPNAVAASDDDWQTEYLGPILSIRIVAGIDEAMQHIAQYSSHHTDAIVTENMRRARQFVRTVDSSSVMVNAATCFADGAEYGLGAEIGISTDKLHVRGPVGALGLTTEKYVVTGDGTIRS